SHFDKRPCLGPCVRLSLGSKAGRGRPTKGLQAVRLALGINRCMSCKYLTETWLPATCCGWYFRYLIGLQLLFALPTAASATSYWASVGAIAAIFVANMAVISSIAAAGLANRTINRSSRCPDVAAKVVG